MIFQPNHHSMGATGQTGTPMTVAEVGFLQRNPETAAAPESSADA